jgi:hypothetical protein
MRPTKIRRTQLPDVSRALYTLLLWADWDAAIAQQERDETKAFELWDNESHARAWAAIESQAVPEWAAVYPGTRPPSWWYWSAPELRRLTGGVYKEITGIHRCHDTGVPYIDGGWKNVPTVESTPALLDRLGLWLSGERARVPASAFASQPFSYAEDDFLQAPSGVPGQQQDDADDDSAA